jgi:nucleotide-binding universal stress UspA family protein
MGIRVVAATDFSEPAAAAAEWAALVARTHGGTLHLVHGVSPLYPPMDQTAMWADLAIQLAAGARDRLEELAQPWRDSGLAVECHAETGRPVQVIVAVAERVGARLVVVGTRGHSRLVRLLLGSTAAQVIEKAPCPVLAVHPEDRRPAVLPRLILVPTDFSADARLAAESSVELLGLDRAQARLLLLHAWQLPGDYALYEYGGAHFLTVHREEAVAAAGSALGEKADRLRQQGTEVEAVLREGSAAGTIVDLAAERSVGLIAMGTHGVSGLERLVVGSTAQQVVQHAPCPVLTVRLPRGRDRAGR